MEEIAKENQAEANMIKEIVATVGRRHDTRKGTMPAILREIIHEYMRNCPMCGIEGITGWNKVFHTHLVLRKWTQTSVTLQCRRCDMRFNFRWETFRNTLIKLAEISSARYGEKEERGIENHNFYMIPAHKIQDFLNERNVSTTKEWGWQFYPDMLEDRMRDEEERRKIRYAADIKRMETESHGVIYL